MTVTRCAGAESTEAGTAASTPPHGVFFDNTLDLRELPFSSLKMKAFWMTFPLKAHLELMCRGLLTVHLIHSAFTFPSFRCRWKNAHCGKHGVAGFSPSARALVSSIPYLPKPTPLKPAIPLPWAARVCFALAGSPGPTQSLHLYSSMHATVLKWLQLSLPAPSPEKSVLLWTQAKVRYHCKGIRLWLWILIFRL